MSRSHSTWPQAARLALAGIWVTVCRERNMRIHLWVLTLVSLLEIVLRPPFRTVVMIIGVSAFVIAAELMNSAIENAVDLTVGQQIHPRAKAAKDAAAGATLVASFAAVMAGILFLTNMWPWRFHMWSSVHMAAAFINIGMTVTTLLTIALSHKPYRAYRLGKRDTGRKGGDFSE